MILFCDTSARLKLFIASVHLAAAHNLHAQFELPLTFASDDRRLDQAAQLLQLVVLP